MQMQIVFLSLKCNNFKSESSRNIDFKFSWLSQGQFFISLQCTHFVCIHFDVNIKKNLDFELFCNFMPQVKNPIELKYNKKVWKGPNSKANA